MGITNNEEDLLLRIKSNNVTVLHDHYQVRTYTDTDSGDVAHFSKCNQRGTKIFPQQIQVNDVG